jgi:uncharacterized protein
MLVSGSVYTAVEAKWLVTTRVTMPVPNLPPAFHGRTIAFLSDIHHSAVVPRMYVDHAVNVTNALEPDIVVLGGDYVTSEVSGFVVESAKYVGPCFESLGGLKAKLGRFAVTGNHDTHSGLGPIHAGMKAAGFQNIDNDGAWLTLDGQRMRLCGVGDLRTQNPLVPAALGDATNKDAVILVSHNPDVAEERVGDDRVGLMLSGHTHGGQVVLPFIGSPPVGLCSMYGQKYRYGLVRGPRCNVLVTAGVGTLMPAFRLNCPPEVMLITLTSQSV